MLALLVFAAVETSTASEPAPPALPGIVVSAPRPRPRAHEHERTVIVVDAGELRRSHGSIPAVLGRYVPLQETNRAAGAPYLRGLIGPENLLLLDGVRLNNSTYRTGPNQYLALLDPLFVERLEVQLGPGSAMYGSDAVGGVIYGVSPAIPAGPSARGGASFSSADLSSATWARAGYGGERAKVAVGGAIRNYEALTIGGGVEVPGTDYASGAWSARADVGLFAGLELGLRIFGSRIAGAGRFDRLTAGELRFYDNADDLGLAELRIAEVGALEAARLTLSIHRTAERVDRFRCGSGATLAARSACLAAASGVLDDEATPSSPIDRVTAGDDGVVTPGAAIEARLRPTDRLTISSGGDVYLDRVSSAASDRRARDGFTSSALPRGAFSDGSEYLSIGAFTTLEVVALASGRHHLDAQAAGRISHFSARAPAVPDLGDVDFSATGFAGSASVRYRFGRLAGAALGFAQGFRAPNLQETTVLGDTGSKFELPNPTLAPMRSDTFELSAWVRALGLEGRASAFVSRIDGVIDERVLSEDEQRARGFGDVGKPVVERVNAEVGLYRGFELDLAFSPVSWATAGLRATWVEGDVTRADGTVVPGRRIPPLSGSARLRLRPLDGLLVEPYAAFALAQARLHPTDEADLRICEEPDAPGRTFADRGAPCSGTPGFFVFGARAALEVDEHVSVDLDVYNLGDARYRVHGSGLDGPGRGFLLGLTASY